MKATRFLQMVVTFLVVVTLLLILTPITSVSLKETSLHKNAESSGDIYYYCFSTMGAFYWNNTTTYSRYIHSKYFKEGEYAYDCAIYTKGVLILSIDGQGANFNIITELCCSFNSNTPANVVHRNFSVGFSNPFLSNFINSYSNSQGSYNKIDGEFGVVQGYYHKDWGYYQQQLDSENKTISRLDGATYDTSPVIVHFPYFNKTLPDTSVPFDNFNSYDRVGNKNILVQSDLGGNSKFLDELLFNQTIKYGGNNVIPLGSGQFFMKLIATNVALGPVALSHYLKEYLPVEIILWIVVMPSAYFIVIRKKKIMVNSKNKRRSKP
ncbi:MAG: hypothetical protein M1427_07070 [Candidatus Thermoplasmatota archaeon]|jgi:hypothetical protein|nr:hypothetical protein [Candidatus Thermoplasmatota archaeon]